MRIGTQAEFRCTPERLWSYLEEPAKLKAWMKGLEDIIPDQPGPLRAGSTAKLCIREGGRLNRYDERITDFDPPRKLALVMSGGNFPAGMAMSVEYTLQPTAGGTRMDYLCVAELRGWYRLFDLVGGTMARRQLKGFLAKLRELVEAPG